MGTATKVQAKIEEMEQRMFKSQLHESQLKERISELTEMLESQKRDNHHLAQQNSLAQSTEVRLVDERSSLRAERQILREKLDRALANENNLLGDLEQIKDALSRSETNRSRLESEMAELSQDRVSLLDALNTADRQNAAMLDDLENLRRENERQQSVISRIAEDRESVTKEKAEVNLQLNLLGRDNRQLNEIIVQLKGEKETVESRLCKEQQLVEDLTAKVSRLDKELAENRLQQDSLQAELRRVETSYRVELEKSQRSLRDYRQRHIDEVAQLHTALQQSQSQAREAESACLQAVARADMAMDCRQVGGAAVANTSAAVPPTTSLPEGQPPSAPCCDTPEARSQESDLRKSLTEVSRLTRLLLTTQRERDEARLLVEHERQRAALRMDDERVGLQERVDMLQETITSLQSALDRSRHDMTLREDESRLALQRATEVSQNLQTQLEKTCADHERLVRDLRVNVAELERQREQLITEVSQLQLQTKLDSETRNDVRADMLNQNTRLRAAEDALATTRRECLELRQRMSELERERLALEASNDDLRRQLKTAEMERSELVRMTNLTRSQLQGNEASRTAVERRAAELQERVHEMGSRANDAQRELVDLRAKVSKAEQEKAGLERELGEARHQLSEERTREEAGKRERSSIKQRLTETENSRSNLQTEVSDLARQLTEMEEALKHRDKAGAQTLEDWQRDFRRLADAKSLLEAKLDSSILTIGELRASLAETRTLLNGTESELSETSVYRQEAEARLSAIHSILRRLLGFRQSLYVSAQGSGSLAEVTKAAVGSFGSDDFTGERWKPDESAEQWRLRCLVREVLGPRTDVSPGREGEATPGVHLGRPRPRSVSPPTGNTKQTMVGESRKYTASTRSQSGDAVREASLSDMIGMREASRKPGYLLTNLRCRGSLPGSDLDPEAVRLSLKQFLRHLVRIERERDDQQACAKSHEQQVALLRRQLADCQGQVSQMQTSCAELEQGKSEALQQLKSLKTMVSEQMNQLSKRDEEYNTAQGKLTLLERQINTYDNEQKQLQSRIDKLKTSELHLEAERRQLLVSLEEVESRSSATEQSRRRLETDVQRYQGLLSETTSEKQVLESRLEVVRSENSRLAQSLDSQCVEMEHLKDSLKEASAKVNDLRTQLEDEQKGRNNLKSEMTELRDHVVQLHKREVAVGQERLLLQDRLETTRQQLNDAKAQLHESLERSQQLLLETTEVGMQRSDLEAQLRQLNDLQADRLHTIGEMQARLNALQSENSGLVEKNTELMHRINEVELEKHAGDCELARLRKEERNWKKKLDRVDAELTSEQQLFAKCQLEKQELSRSLRQVEEDNLTLRREVKKLQTMMNEQQGVNAARIQEENTRQRVETDNELERQREMLQEAEKGLRLRERGYRQKIRGLEEEVTILKDQLAQEMARHHRFISRSSDLKTPAVGTRHSPESANRPGPESSVSSVTEAAEKLETSDVRKMFGRHYPTEGYLHGLYKPTIAPSRYDPTFHQVTGSTPSNLCRSLEASVTFTDPRRKPVGQSPSPWTRRYGQESYQSQRTSAKRPKAVTITTAEAAAGTSRSALQGHRPLGEGQARENDTSTATVTTMNRSVSDSIIRGDP